MRNAVVALPLFVVVTGFLIWEFPPLEGRLDYYPWLLFAHGRTEFAPGYSDSGFARVTKGMAINEVEAVLGRPLQVWNNPDTGTINWEYSKSRSDSHYRRRAVVFEGDKVVEVIAETYFD